METQWKTCAILPSLPVRHPKHCIQLFHFLFSDRLLPFNDSPISLHSSSKLFMKCNSAIKQKQNPEILLARDFFVRQRYGCP